MKKIQLLVLLAGLLQCPAILFAGGPLLTDENCKPVVYLPGDMPIPYTVDQGPLGLFSSAQATAIVDECFAVWQAVPTVSISFQNAGFLPEDINENFVKHKTSKQLENALVLLQSQNKNPVIFDSDGSIIDAFFGTGASDNIIGFSGSSYDYDSVNGYYYTAGLSVLNGLFTQEPYNWDAIIYKATFVHEFGHFIGLDHTQINGQFVHDDDTANDIYIPTMYPTATDNDSSLGRLNPDDEAAVTMLYPASAAIVNAVYGKIHGTLYWQSGWPALGANVVAIKQGDEQMSQFSSVSDYCMAGDGAFDMLVTPGTYDFIVEPIDPYFTGGSSVGPYAAYALSRSFVFPAVKTDYPENLGIAAGETKEVQFVVRHDLRHPFPGLLASLLQFLGLARTAGN